MNHNEFIDNPIDYFRADHIGQEKLWFEDGPQLMRFILKWISVRRPDLCSQLPVLVATATHVFDDVMAYAQKNDLFFEDKENSWKPAFEKHILLGQSILMVSHRAKIIQEIARPIYDAMKNESS